MRARPLTLLASVSLAIPLSACSATVAGDVDGQKVPALFSTFFTQQQTKTVDQTGQPATLFSVSGGSMSLFDGCNGSAKRQTAVNDAFDQQTKDLVAAAGNVGGVQDANEKFVDALVTYDKKNLPSDYWTVNVSVGALSESDLPSAKADIDVQNPDPKAVIVGNVQLCRVNNWPEKKKDADGNSSLESHMSCFGARKGTVDVKAYTKNKTLQITADVDLSPADGALDPNNDSGSATITVSGGWCQDLENALDDNTKLVEDRNGATTG